MYSYEIENLLKLRNYLITVQEYYKIANSPQIDHIKYENDTFFMWSNDGYTFKFKLKEG